MTRYTIAIGALLILLGIVPYVVLYARADDAPSVTALIPAFVGTPILLLGLLALNDRFRMHAMHIVSLLALVGSLLPSGRLAMQLARGAEVKPTATASLVLMAVLCGVLLVLCIKSFVDARRAAASKE